MLRKVKGDIDLTTLGVKLQAVRKTRDGDLLLELERDDHGAEILMSALARSLGADAQVRTLKPSTQIEVVDMDAVTTEEDLRAALEAVLMPEEHKDIRITSIRRAFRDAQIAVVAAPIAIANKLLSMEKVRVAWVYCRLRQRTQLIRCYRCHGYGHLAPECQSTIDRSKNCYRCGQPGHLAKTCKGEPTCLSCMDTGRRSDHHPASNRCPLFKAHLAKAAGR